ncbi:MAG: efflux RND transporter periplasmic adaptor subunit [Anaerolineales bacterium]|nr:efflux RND transporter periplasmic adaptor subunit [Anaerolineales bacterium]
MNDKKSKKIRNWIILAVVVVIVILAVLFVRGRSAALQSSFETAPAERGTLTAIIGATGTVRANQSAILVWQAGGSVATVNVEPGERVAADELLASLDPASLSQNLILARADVVSARRALDSVLDSAAATAQAELALYQAQDALEAAQTRYDILASTYGEDSTSRRLLQARANLDLAQATLARAQGEYDRLADGPDPDDVAAAQARLDAAEATLRLAEIHAPFAGTVTVVQPIPGDLVSPGATAFRVDDLSRLLIDVQVSEVDINNLAVGQAVAITFDAISDQEYQGEVAAVALVGTVVQNVVNFNVTVVLRDADEQVKPGMTAAVTIVVQQLEDVLLVPNRAVRIFDGERIVYVQRDSGLIERVVIILGASSDLVSEVIGGDLREGDRIVLNPSADFMTMDGPPPFVGR